MTEVLLVLAGARRGARCVVLLVRRRRGDAAPAPTRRILFPYVGIAAVDLGARRRAADRPDRERHARPAYLAPVPMAMPLEAPIPRTVRPRRSSCRRRSSSERRPRASRSTAASARGRTVRHALRQLIEAERYDRIVVAAATAHTDGLSSADVAWLLEHAPARSRLRPADEAALAAA